MNYFDYAYDLNKIEDKFSSINVKSNVRHLKSILEDSSKEEFVECVINLLNSINTTYDIEDIERAYQDGKEDGYDEGYDVGKEDSDDF